MTAEEIRARAIAAEKRKKREYNRTHRDQLRPHEKKWRENHPVEYLQSQIKYLTRKIEEEPDNKRCGYNLRYATKKLNELLEQKMGGA